MQDNMWSNQPGYTRVEVRGVVRTEGRPRHRETGDGRTKIKNLCRCGGCCWWVDEIFTTDSRGNNEDDENRNPSAILIPTEGQETIQLMMRMTIITS